MFYPIVFNFHLDVLLSELPCLSETVEDLCLSGERACARVHASLSRVLAREAQRSELTFEKRICSLRFRNALLLSLVLSS
jgi:hypothetical protein